MRKMVRIGAVAVAASAVFFYLAANYALHHPQSLVSQLVLTSFHLGTDHNPFFKAGQSVGKAAYRVAKAEVTDSDMATEEEEQLLCVPPGTPANDEPKPSAISPENRDFIIRTIKDELHPAPLAHDTKAHHRELPMPLFGQAELCIPAANDDEDYPRFMPRCSDDDAPAVTQAAGKSDAKSSTDPLFQFWLGLFQSAAREADTLGAAEPQEDPRYFHDEEPPQCQEDPVYQHQYPGCPFTGKCPEQTAPPKMIVPVPTLKPKTGLIPSGALMRPNGQSDSACQMTDPKKYELPARLRQLLPGDSTEAEEEPAHPEVDTMEFRPTDAKPGEFNPKPM
jgi:hypothetical protein